MGALRRPALGVAVARLGLCLLLEAAAGVADERTDRSIYNNKFTTFFELLDQSGELAQEWEGAQGDLCAMKGFTCKDKQVIEIDLSGQGLVGDLTNDNWIYEHLTELEKLDLSNNQLGYNVAPVPNNLSLLPKLEYLDLSNNLFVGILPTFTLGDSRFGKLKYLDLSNNKLSGKLRWTWATMPSLEVLLLSGNEISGTLPLSWYEDDGFPSLTTLDVAGNDVNLCGDSSEGDMPSAGSALAGRSVAFGCHADGSDAIAPLPVAPVPIAEAPYPLPPGVTPLLDPDGDPIVDPMGNPVFAGADGIPLVTDEGLSIFGPNGRPLTDVNGNPVATSPAGGVLTDPDGNPVFETPDGEPLVAADGTTLIGRDGQFVQDEAGNPALLDPEGDVVTDAEGNPIFVGPDGSPLVSANGTSLSDAEGTLATSAAGNPVALTPGGSPALDPSGDPIFVGPDGAPLVDASGESLFTPDGQPRTDAFGNPLVSPSGAPFVGPDGEPIGAVNGTLVFGPDGLPLFDADGAPIVLPPGAQHPAAPPPAGPAVLGNGTLPDGSRAADLPVPTCALPLPPTCAADGSAPVCLPRGTLAPPGRANTTDAVFSRFYPGASVEEMVRQTTEIVGELRSLAAGLPVSLLEWREVDSTAARRRLRRAARRLAQAGGESTGVVGYFLVEDAGLDGLADLVSRLQGFESVTNEDGTVVLQRQDPVLPGGCESTSNAGVIVASILAAVLAALLVAVSTALYLSRRHDRDGDGKGGLLISGGRSSTRHTHATAAGGTDAFSNATLTPTAAGGHDGDGGHDSGSSERSGGTPGAARARERGIASFGSAITGRIGDGSESPSSGSRGEEGNSQASFGKSMLTLANGIGLGALGRRGSMPRSQPSGIVSGGSGGGGGGGSSEAGDLTRALDGMSVAALAAALPEPLVAGHSPDASGDSSGGGVAGALGYPVPAERDAAAVIAAAAAAAGVASAADRASGGGGDAGGGAGAAPRGGVLPPIAEHTISASDTIDSSHEATVRSGATSAAGGAGITPSPLAPYAEPHAPLGAPRGTAEAPATTIYDMIKSDSRSSLEATDTAGSAGDAAAAAAAAAEAPHVRAEGHAAPPRAARLGSGESNAFHTVSISSWDSGSGREPREGVREGRGGGEVSVATGERTTLGTRGGGESLGSGGGGNGAAMLAAAERAIAGGMPPGSHLSVPSPYDSASADGLGGGTSSFVSSSALMQAANSLPPRRPIRSPVATAVGPNGLPLAPEASAAPAAPGTSSGAAGTGGSSSLLFGGQNYPVGGGGAGGGVGGGWLLNSRGGVEILEELPPDHHIEGVQQFNSAGMLDSFRSAHREGGASRVSSFAGSSRLRPSETGSPTRAADVDFDGPLNADTLLRSLSRPPPEAAGGETGVLHEALGVLDSMSRVAEHTQVPPGLDTAQMISVPQQPFGSPPTSAPASDYHAYFNAAGDPSATPRGSTPHPGDSPLSGHVTAGSPVSGTASGHASGHASGSPGQRSQGSAGASGGLNVPDRLEEMLQSQSMTAEDAERALRSASQTHSSWGTRT